MLMEWLIIGLLLLILIFFGALIYIVERSLRRGLPVPKDPPLYKYKEVVRWELPQYKYTEVKEPRKDKQ